MITRILALALLFALVLPVAAEAKGNPNITCKVTASKSVITPGESVTISWLSSQSIVSFGPDGLKTTPMGTMVVKPTTKSIYKFKFVGLGGNAKCGVRIRMAGEQVPA